MGRKVNFLRLTDSEVQAECVYNVGKICDINIDVNAT